MWVPPFLFTLAPAFLKKSMQIYAEQRQKIFLNKKGKQILFTFLFLTYLVFYGQQLMLLSCCPSRGLVSS